MLLRTNGHRPDVHHDAGQPWRGPATALKRH
jgi:hypothetical protein